MLGEQGSKHRYITPEVALLEHQRRAIFTFPESLFIRSGIMIKRGPVRVAASFAAEIRGQQPRNSTFIRLLRKLYNIAIKPQSSKETIQ
jgi:hypothetical protein